MAYDVAKETEDILNIIKDQEITFFDDISLYVQPSIRTLYDWKLHEMQTIKDALRANKLRIKARMRKRWQTHDSPVLQVAAYKLIAEDDELVRLTMNKFEHTGKDGEAIQTENKHIVEIHDFSGNQDQ